MSRRKVEAQSEPKLLGEAEATWKVIGWTGPLFHFMRSKAESFVNVPTENSSTSDIKLRFHLKPYHGHQEPQQKFCEKRNDFIAISTSCDCNTCKQIPLEKTDDIPLEFLPQIPTRSSGYSLLVDVLDGPDNLALAVSVNKLNGESWYGLMNNLVIVDKESGYVNLPVVENFWRMMKWTEGKGGTMDHCTRTTADKVDDATFQLTVAAYEIKSTGTDVPTLEGLVKRNEQNLTENVPEVISKNSAESNAAADFDSILDVENIPDVILKTKDGMGIHAMKSVLIEKSEFFRKYLTPKNCKQISVPFQSEPLLFILHWMYTGKFAAATEMRKYFSKICHTAKKLRINLEFWTWLEANLWEFFAPNCVPKFLTVVEQYKLNVPTKLMGKIEFIQNKTIGIGEASRQWEFEEKWNVLTALQKNVDYLTLDIGSEKSNPISVKTIEVSSADSLPPITNSGANNLDDGTVSTNSASFPNSPYDNYQAFVPIIMEPVLNERSYESSYDNSGTSSFSTAQFKPVNLSKPNKETATKFGTEKDSTKQQTHLPAKEAGDIELLCNDGIIIHAHKQVLSRKSALIRKTQQFTFKSTHKDQVVMDCESEPLLLILYWIYNGQWSSEIGQQYLDEICRIATMLELDADFWKWLEDNVMLFFEVKREEKFMETVFRYNVASPAELVVQISAIKRKLSDEKRKALKEPSFFDKMLQNVNGFLLVESAKLPAASVVATQNRMYFQPRPSSQSNKSPVFTATVKTPAETDSHSKRVANNIAEHKVENADENYDSESSLDSIYVMLTHPDTQITR